MWATVPIDVAVPMSDAGRVTPILDVAGQLDELTLRIGGLGRRYHRHVPRRGGRATGPSAQRLSLPWPRLRAGG